MKTYIELSLILLLACSLQVLQAQPKITPNASRLSAGISAGHYRHDPGLAIEFTSRAVFQYRLNLRVRAGIQWLEAYPTMRYPSIAYHTFSTGLVYNGSVFDRARFYAELGILGIIPDARFSDKTFVDGIYEFNGLEISLLTKKEYTLCLYLGVGPAFTKASAEKIEGNPRYANGLYYINGIRIYFGE